MISLMRAHVRHSPLTTKGTEVLILDEAEERWNHARVAAVGKDAISVQARTPLLAQTGRTAYTFADAIALRFALRCTARACTAT